MDKFTKAKCDVCKETFKQGPHAYPLIKCSGYEIFVCKICYDGNHDGWNSFYEKAVIEHCQRKGIGLPERNAKGFLPREF